MIGAAPQTMRSLRERLRMLLAVPVVPADQIDRAVSNAGLAPAVWGSTCCKHADRLGYIYFGRVRGLVKVGFTQFLCARMRTLQLEPEVVICFARRDQESPVQRLLNEERVYSREHYCGEQTEALMAALRALSAVTFSELPQATLLNAKLGGKRSPSVPRGPDVEIRNGWLEPPCLLGAA